MKKINANLAVLAMLLLFCSTSIFAQEESKKDKKQVVIITKKVDENGNVISEKIVKEGEDADVFIMDSDGGNIHSDHKEIKVDVNATGDEKIIKIKTGEGDDAEVEVIKLKGELSEEMKAKLKEKGVFIHEGGKHDVRFKSKGTPNQACLGVMIGKKETVEHVDGEETTISEGESDLGVPILSIIEDSGAEDAGLKKDDIITEINGAKVGSIEDVLNFLEPMKAGASVVVSYLRDGQANQTTATLKACGSNNNVFEEEFEWINEEGEEMNGEGNNWIFMEEGSEGQQNKKIIIKKRKDDGTEVIEEIEIDGENDFEFEVENNQTLDVRTIDIFPNPTDSKLTLEFTAPKNKTTIQLLEVTGKEVYSETINDFDGNYKKEIDLSNAVKGALILSIKQGDKVFSERIMVQ